MDYMSDGKMVSVNLSISTLAYYPISTLFRSVAQPG